MKRIILFTIFVFLCVLSYAPSSQAGGGDTTPLKQVKWPFDGVMGTFDRQAIQRGYQVYKEVCASCHSMDLLAYRNLLDIGFSEAEAKTIAADATIVDGPDNEGEMFDRPGRLSDRFAAPYPNEQASRAANSGAYPPDLSLITKARMDGPNYIYSLLTGYSDEIPVDIEIEEGKYYNLYFPGSKISMAPPLTDELVEYMDGMTATVDQLARDVTMFLQWAAEPEMEERKEMGLKVLFFLILFTVFFYIAKTRIWTRLKSK